MVVGQDRGPQRGGVGEVPAAVAEVRRGARRRVLHVLRVGDPVPVGVHTERAPGAGDELHRTDGAVPRHVAVPVPAVGVRDRGEAVAVEDRTQHRGAVRTVDRTADEGARLDLADRRQQAHRQVAAGRGAGDRGAVGLEEDVGDVGLHGRAAVGPVAAMRTAGGGSASGGSTR